jgi:tripartite-type tricarboxylate transporter receptor subunit TctC
LAPPSPLIAWPLGAAAQTFPDRPIRLVIPYAAGGSTDNMARVLQEPLQKALGQSVIVDNKAGAGGALAAREVMRAKPDGYTLFFVNNGNLAVVPFVQKDANYDGQKDFTSVALVSSAPMVAVIPAALPVTDLKGSSSTRRRTRSRTRRPGRLVRPARDRAARLEGRA